MGSCCQGDVQACALRKRRSRAPPARAELFQNLLSAGQKHCNDRAGLHGLPARPCKADKEDLHGQNGGAQQQRFFEQPEGDQMPGVSRPYQKDDQIARQRRQRRALHAQRRRDQHRVQRNIDARAEQRRPEGQPAFPRDRVDAAHKRGKGAQQHSSIAAHSTGTYCHAS